MEDKRQELDNRVKKTLHKYFEFFRIHGYLPKKWKKHIIKHLSRWFSERDQLKEDIEKKDETFNSLTIQGILDQLQAETDNWNSAAAALEADNEKTENKLLETEMNGATFKDMLAYILEDQEEYDWYNWGEVNQNRIKNTRLYFSDNETQSYSGGVITVKTDAAETGYTDGVLTLPAFLG